MPDAPNKWHVGDTAVPCPIADDYVDPYGITLVIEYTDVPDALPVCVLANVADELELQRLRAENEILRAELAQRNRWDELALSIDEMEEVRDGRGNKNQD